MNNTDQQKTIKNRYQVEIKEQLDESWTEWFSDFELEYRSDDQNNPFTILTGEVMDQAALNGILTKIWNLNLTVLSVKLID
ncbi:MAG: hypothetical protein PVI26_14260 [Chitinispirillia bacterium]|jgi:hypothetical protein